MAKKPKPGDIDLFKELLPAVGRKDNAWWDSLSEDQQREFSAWTTMRWLSNVEGPLQAYWLIAINQRVNKDFSLLKGNSQSNHNRLLFQLMCSVNAENRTPRVKWVPACKRTKDHREKILAELYPTSKIEDIITLAKIISDDELQQLMTDMGCTDKELSQVVDE